MSSVKSSLARDENCKDTSLCGLISYITNTEILTMLNFHKVSRSSASSPCKTGYEI